MPRTAKPHLCKDCGETDGIRFYGDQKSRCIPCHNSRKYLYRPLKGKRKNAYEKMPTDKQEEFMTEINKKNDYLTVKYDIPRSLISSMRKAAISE